MPASMKYTVASAQQLSGRFPPLSRLDSCDNKLENGRPKTVTSRRKALDPKAKRTLSQCRQRPMIKSSPRRMDNNRLAQEITLTLLSTESGKAATHKDKTFKSDENERDDTESDSDSDSDLLLLKEDTATSTMKPQERRVKWKKDLEEDFSSVEKERRRRARKAKMLTQIRVVQPPKLCVVKCLTRLRDQARLLPVALNGPIKLETQHVDSLSSALAGRIKSLMLSSESAIHTEKIIYTKETIPDQPSITAYLSQPFINTCITDNNIPGQIVKLQSRHFAIGTAGVRVGECEFFNLSPTFQTDPPFSRKVTPPENVREIGLLNDPKRTLRIEVDAEGRPRFILTFWGDLHPLVRSKCKLGWISNMDITDGIRKAAIAEYYSHLLGFKVTCKGGSALDGRGGLEWDLSSRSRNEPETPKSDLNKEESELQKASETGRNAHTQQVEDKMRDIKLNPVVGHLPALSTIYQEKVLSLVTQLRDYHSSVLVFSTELGIPETQDRLAKSQVPSSSVFRLRFVSSDLALQHEDLVHNISAMSQKALLELGEVFGGVEERVAHILWGKDARRARLYCVPVMESRQDKMGEDEMVSATWPRWWVCFMGDLKDQKLWK